MFSTTAELQTAQWELALKGRSARPRSVPKILSRTNVLGSMRSSTSMEFTTIAFFAPFFQLTFVNPPLQAPIATGSIPKQARVWSNRQSSERRRQWQEQSLQKVSTNRWPRSVLRWLVPSRRQKTRELMGRYRQAAFFSLPALNCLSHQTLFLYLIRGR